MSTRTVRGRAHEASRPAALRAVESFFSDHQSSDEAVRVCRGTSCQLAGAGDVERELSASVSCRGVYCLGYCDRSPAALHPDGRVAVGEAARRSDAAPAPAAPEIRSLARTPVVTARIAAGDHGQLSRAREAGVYSALERAVAAGPASVLATIEASGERGRGGAGFPTGAKWRACAEAPGDIKYVVANGDEGDPGSFVDRLLMEHDPHAVIEGLALCGFAVGAREGIAYVRSEYPAAAAALERAIEQAREAGILGESVLGSAWGFEVRVARGHGSYVCGEETALLNALEGGRGEVRLRPPYPTTSGLFGRPTVVNNAETLVNAPWIVGRGAEAFHALGSDTSIGTKVLSLSSGFAKPGLLEVEFGTDLRRVIEEEAGGPRGDAPLAAVALGGPMGSVLLPDAWDVPIDHDAMAARGIQLGHGGLVAIPEDADFGALVRHWLGFFASESCGRCVPCAAGSARALRLLAGESDPARPLLRRTLEVSADASLCAFGQLLPRPVLQLLDAFGDRIGNGAGS